MTIYIQYFQIMNHKELSWKISYFSQSLQLAFELYLEICRSFSLHVHLQFTLPLLPTIILHFALRYHPPEVYPLLSYHSPALCHSVSSYHFPTV